MQLNWMTVLAILVIVACIGEQLSLNCLVTYAVILVDSNFDFTNLDRWYERDAGERVGSYILYHVKPRDYPRFGSIRAYPFSEVGRKLR